MVEAKIKINTPEDLFVFVKLANRCGGDVIVYTNNGFLNANSILKLCNIDLEQELKVEFHGDIPLEVREGMKKFIVN